MQVSTTQFIEDPDRDRMIVAHTERFDGALDTIMALRNEGFHGSKDARHLAELPGIVIEQYCITKGITWAQWWADRSHLKAMLNDPDLAYFRVSPEKV